MSKQIKFQDFAEEAKVRKDEFTNTFQKVLNSGWYILGKEVENFENEYAKYLGTKYCVGVANGLEALQIALMAKEIGKGDEIITTPVSAVATTLAILAVGATPIFVDVKENGQIDENLISNLITKKTKAIIPVDLYGQPCDLIAIKEIAKKYNLFFVEDACQAHGSTFKGIKLGTYGDVGAFSFYPTKNIGAIGDGGALVTNNKKMAEIFRQIRDYGQSSKYVHTRYGLNSRLDELQAALMDIKLKYLDNDNNIRRKIAIRYIKNLKNIKDIQLLLPESIYDSNFHLFVIKTKLRNELQAYLKENGIYSLVHYPITIPDQPLFGNKYKDIKIPVARKLVNEVLSLPCHPYLDNTDVDYISNKITEFFYSQ